MSGSTNYGLIENAITHPANGYFASPGYVAGTNLILNGSGGGTLAASLANSSQFEADPFPRAIVSRMKMYYPDLNFANPNGATRFTNEYYTQQVTNFADSNLLTTFPADLSLLRFPLLPLGITPSVAVYKKQ